MQQQTNFFTPTQKHLIQLHGFTNITDIIYVKPLYSVRSLVVYPSLRPDSVAIPLFSLCGRTTLSFTPILLIICDISYV